MAVARKETGDGHSVLPPMMQSAGNPSAAPKTLLGASGTGLAGLGAIAYLQQAIRRMCEVGNEQGQSSCDAARSDKAVRCLSAPAPTSQPARIA